MNSIFLILFVACGVNATATPSTAMNGSSGGVGDGVPCIANGNAAIKFLGFDEVSEHQMAVFVILTPLALRTHLFFFFDERERKTTS